MSEQRKGCGGCLLDILALIAVILGLLFLMGEHARQGGDSPRELHTVDKLKP